MWSVEADTTELLKSVLEGAPSVPAPITQVGRTKVAWWEGKAGDAVVMAEGGSPDDRYLGEQIVTAQLEVIGYKRAQFTFDAEHHTAGWPDIMQKAKRLIQSTNVTLLRNGWNNIVAHVIGDHGEYNCEIGRDDPESRSITTWQCECPWDQYAWQRTRKWKKYEGRPCAHVLAAFWKSQATPLDEAPPGGQSPTPGQALKAPPAPSGGGGGSPGGAPAMPPSEPAPAQTSFGPEEAMGTSAPMAPPGEPGVLPKAPMDQLSEMQPPIPGATPGGMPANPSIVSVPGAKMPTPFNPIQFPGGTYSKVGTQQSPWIHSTDREFQPGDLVQPTSVTGEETWSDEAPGYDPSKVYFWHRRALDDPAGMNRILPHAENAAHHYEVEPIGDIQMDPEGEASDAALINEAVDQDWPNVDEEEYYPYSYGSEWYHNHSFTSPQARVIRKIPHEEIWGTHYSKTAAEEFTAPEIVRLKTEGWGIAEGKSEAHGAGQYQAIPMGSTGEVLGQDPTTGWVEVIFPLHESSYLEPYHVKMFCESSDLEHTTTAPPGPFIKRR